MYKEGGETVAKKKKKRLTKKQKWSRADIFSLISLILGFLQFLVSLFKK